MNVTFNCIEWIDEIKELYTVILHHGIHAYILHLDKLYQQ